MYELYYKIVFGFFYRQMWGHYENQWNERWRNLSIIQLVLQAYFSVNTLNYKYMLIKMFADGVIFISKVGDRHVVT